MMADPDPNNSNPLQRAKQAQALSIEAPDKGVLWANDASLRHVCSLTEGAST